MKKYITNKVITSVEKQVISIYKVRKYVHSKIVQDRVKVAKKQNKETTCKIRKNQHQRNMKLFLFSSWLKKKASNEKFYPIGALHTIMDILRISIIL